MKRILYIVILGTLLFCGCVKKNPVSTVVNESDILVCNTYEYSYLTEEGKITREYTESEEQIVPYKWKENRLYEEYNDEMLIRYHSLGLPDISESKMYDNGIYYNFDGNASNTKSYLDKEATLFDDVEFFYEIKTDKTAVKRAKWFNGGYFYRAINNKEVKALKSADCVEVFKDIDGIENLCTLSNDRIIVNAHIFMLENGELVRTTINGSEKTVLNSGLSKNIHYKDGYIYYLYKTLEMKEYMLYRIKLNGTRNEQMSDIACFDYVLAENGVICLNSNSSEVSIIYEEFDDQNTKVHLGKFIKKEGYAYRMIGTIGDIVYISIINEHGLSVDKVKIYAYSDGELVKIHESKEEVSSKLAGPFIYKDYIYYGTPIGIFRFNPQDQKCKIVAELFFFIPATVS